MTVESMPAAQLGDLIRHRARILVVDDQPMNIRVLHQLLAKDYEVFMATSGAEAIPFCEHTPPDLVLLDVIMPEMDGLEVCKRLKASSRTASIPVMFITASTTPESEDACWDAGGVDFVTKPINPSTLKRRVQAQLMLKFQADDLRQLAYVDGLTGISNRRTLEELLAREWQRSRRSGHRVTAIMLDVDHFKRYNDRYGHLAGDDCLRQIAQVMKVICRRAYDIVGRYGGEEFCCVLPEANPKYARAVADRILSSVYNLHIPHAGNDDKEFVTVSIGVAHMLPTGENNPNDLLALADGQLYAAKMAGRNCVVSAE